MTTTELFNEIGPDKLSLRKLAEYKGVSHTLLYRYFASKEALFSAIRLESLNFLFKLLLQCDQQNHDKTPLQRIRAAAYAMQTYSTSHHQEYRFLFSTEQPDLQGNVPLLALRHNVFAHIVSISEEAQQQGQIEMDDRTWVHIVWATLHGVLSLNKSQQLIEGPSFNTYWIQLWICC